MATTLIRKPVPLQGWHLADQAAMLEALGDLSGQGWRGALTPGAGGWRLELNADNPTRQVIAAVGEWLVSDGGLRKLSGQELTDNYDEVV